MSWGDWCCEVQAEPGGWGPKQRGREEVPRGSWREKASTERACGCGSMRGQGRSPSGQPIDMGGGFHSLVKESCGWGVRFLGRPCDREVGDVRKWMKDVERGEE